MSKLILCEGKTDAILLSYYLEKTCGWAHGRAPKGLAVKVDEMKGESGYWYYRGDESLLICGVGGQDKFSSFFRDKIRATIEDADAFSKIAVVIDRDNRAERSVVDAIKSAFRPIITNVENDRWLPNPYGNSYKEESTVDFLLVIIPPEKEGALETLLLDAISESEYDKPIVEKSIAYID